MCIYICVYEEHMMQIYLQSELIISDIICVRVFLVVCEGFFYKKGWHYRSGCITVAPLDVQVPHVRLVHLLFACLPQAHL